MNKLLKCPNCGKDLTLKDIKMWQEGVSYVGFYLDHEGKMKTQEFSYGVDAESLYCNFCKANLDIDYDELKRLVEEEVEDEKESH